MDEFGGAALDVGEKPAEAVSAFQDSYAFFCRHPVVDRYRALVTLSGSAISYREMALVNMAFAFGQIGNGARARKAYEHALSEFPQSSIATAALRLMDAAGAESTDSADGGATWAAPPRARIHQRRPDDAKTPSRKLPDSRDGAA